MAKATDVRTTPSEVMAQMRAAYGEFDLDAAALNENKCAPVYFGPDHRNPAMRDALSPYLAWSSHGSLVWLNCPYSEIPVWLDKVKRQINTMPDNTDMRVVCLLPSSTSTHWWHRRVWNRHKRAWRPLVRSVQFWPVRINFGPHKTGAKWPSVVVEFGKP